MTKIKQILIFFLCICLSFIIGLPSSLAETTKASPPIAKGTVNKVTKVYWGKAEYFPVVGTLWTGDEINIYEYDKTWILTRYETWVTYGGQTVSHEFYGYVKRSDIDCDPKLEGDESKKAERGPGKRKGKKWKPKQPKDTASPEPTNSPSASPNSPEPTVETEDLLEYDWIIRTPGVCQVVVNVEEVKFVARFNLMAMKFGGYSASSLPTYNDGKQNPYCGYVTFSLKQSMSEYLSDNNLGFLQGSGGISIDSYNNNARFNIDSQKDDATSTIITINVNATSVLNPQITDENQGIQVGGEMFTDTRVMPLDIKLVKSGSGYQLVLLNMRPGGGDLKFPAMLEKYPLDDITKAERERIKKEQDAERQRKAREEQERVLKEQKEKAEKGMDDEMKKDEKGEKNEPDVAPGAPGDDEIELAPLEPIKEGDTNPPATPEIELAPLEPIPATPEIELAPLVPPENEGSGADEDITLAPLTGGGTSEEVEYFPNKN